MGKAYPTRDDIRMRLHRTIVKYEDDYYTADCDAPAPSWDTIVLRPLSDNRQTRTSESIIANQSEIDATTPPLGYFNWRGEAFYISRVPERRQNEGIRLENCMFQPRMPTGPWVTSSSLNEMFKDIYPTLDEALIRLDGGETKIAIARDFAVGWIERKMSKGVYFKERLIGHFDSKRQGFILFHTKETSLIIRFMNKLGVFNGKLIA